MSQYYILLFFFLPLLLVGQDNWIIEVSEHPLEKDTVVKIHDAPEIPCSTYEKPIPKLTKKYTGYAIELCQSSNLLRRSHQDFIGFGKVCYTKFDNQFHYLILLDFNKRKSIKKYFKDIVQPLQPKSKVVRFLNGVQTTVFNWGN